MPFMAMRHERERSDPEFMWLFAYMLYSSSASMVLCRTVLPIKICYLVGAFKVRILALSLRVQVRVWVRGFSYEQIYSPLWVWQIAQNHLKTGSIAKRQWRRAMESSRAKDDAYINFWCLPFVRFNTTSCVLLLVMQMTHRKNYRRAHVGWSEGQIHPQYN